MAIEVGALVAAIEADARQAIAEVKRYQDAASRTAKTLKELQANTKAAFRAEETALRQLNRAKAASASLQDKIYGAAQGGRIKLTVKDVKALTAAQERLVAAERAYAAAQQATSRPRADIARVTRNLDAAKQELAVAQQIEREAQQTLATMRAQTAEVDKRIAKERATMSGRNRAEYTSWWKNALAERDAGEKRLADADKQRAAEAKQSARELARTERQRIVETQRLERQRAREAQSAERQRLATIRQREAAEARAARAGMTRGGGVGLSTFGVTGTLVGTMAAGGFLRAANDAQLLQQRLAQVTSSGAEAGVMFRQLFEASQRLRTPVADMTELFVKLRQSNDALGYSYDETLQVTEAFSAALRISGASGQTASSALLQFGQAMAKGKLDGDEFRTVAENASEVLRSLERAFGVSRGEILKWREEGKLTSKMIADVLIRDKQALIDKAAQLAPTMRQAASQFRNAIVMMITDSEDLEKAFGGVALSISKLSTAITDNKEGIDLLIKILGYGAAAATLGKGLGLVAENLGRMGTAIATIAGYATRFPKLFAGGIATGGIILGSAVDAAAESRALDRQNKLVREAVRNNQAYDVILNRVRKAQEELTLAALNYNASVESGNQRAIAAAKNRVTTAFDALATERRVLDGIEKQRRMLTKGAKEVVITADAPGTGEAAKDTTDEFLRAMEAVTAAGLQTEAQMTRVRAIQAEANTVIGNGAAPAETLAQALERVATIGNLYGNVIATTTPEIDEQVSSLDLLLENYGLLVDLGLDTVDQGQLIEEMYEEQKVAIQGLTKGTEAYYEALQKLAQLERLLRKERKQDKEDAEAKAKMTNAERRTQMLQRQLFNILSSAPGQLVVDFFEAIGDKVDAGTESVAEKMRKGFGNIFGNLGQVLIQSGMDRLGDFFAPMSKALLKSLGKMMVAMGIETTIFGKLLAKIKASLANPLVAGFAMVGIGAAMVAYGRRMGGIGRGGTGDVGGTGQIGGLGIGAQPTPGGMFMPTFGQGPMFPNASQSAPVGAAAPVTVNATIIGPNDPVAQRQIAQLVDNAARRGLVQGGGVRT